MRYKIGTRENKPVIAEYTRTGQSSLPELRIRSGGKLIASWRGSSLGPTNAQCDPSVDDLINWQVLAGLPEDKAQALRSISAHVGAHKTAWGKI